MKCPYCLYPESKVIDSRPADDGSRIRRRRECIQCFKRFTTYESIESQPLIIIKRDRSRQVFDRNKLLSGMLRACEKRPVSLDALEHAIDEIESQLQNSLRWRSGKWRLKSSVISMRSLTCALLRSTVILRISNPLCPRLTP